MQEKQQRRSIWNFAMSEIKFIRVNDEYCDSWESDRVVIIAPACKGDTYDVYVDPPEIGRCCVYCDEDIPHSQFCLCGACLPDAKFRTLKEAKEFLEGFQ